MTTISTASNGTKAPASAPERLHGMARVEDAMTYHLASIAHDAACEAERLCNDIYHAASDGYLRSSSADDTAPEGTGKPSQGDQITEAIRCLTAAQDFLRQLNGYQPPF
jgi:hypothetical protein